MLLIVAELFLLNGLFIIFFICKRMSTTVWVDGTVQFTFFLTEHYHCDALRFAYCHTCTLMFLSLKLENGPKKYVQNVAEVKHGFVKLVVILLLFTK